MTGYEIQVSVELWEIMVYDKIEIVWQNREWGGNLFVL